MKSLLQMSLFPMLPVEQNQAWFKDALATLNITETGGWADTFGDSLRLWNAQNSKAKVKAISLFSGGGGLDIGFHDAGFTIVECNELEPTFAATLRRNSMSGGRLEGTQVICQDIHQYIPEVKGIDFIIGGPPCQTFSAASARAAGVNGIDDERGNLFLQYARIINKLQPKGFLFENVYRIIGAQSGKAWKQIQVAFEELGYKLYWRILDAADYGVPQFRERLIIVGLKSGEFLFPFPTHGPDSPDGHGYYSARDAVVGLDTSNCTVGLGGRHGHLLNDIPPGLNYSFYTEKLGHPNPIFAWRSKFSDYLYKADPETPVRTIKAQGGQYTGPFSWENRSFTIAEFKRLQTFPDDYAIEGNRQTIIQQLGNSVPPQFARILALSILEQVFQVPIPFAISYMPHTFQLGFRTRKAALTEVYEQKATIAISKLNQHKPPYINTAKGTEYFVIGDDLKVHTGLSSNNLEYFADYNLHASAWSILLSDSNYISSTPKYAICVKPSTKKSPNSSNIEVILSSTSNQIRSVLALWKIFEVLLQRYMSKDDLVQLFGYYQYKNSYKIEMHLHDPTIATEPLWSVLKSITSGCHVGAITPLSELSFDFGLTEYQLLAIFRQMKDIGYEIRNHNTNKQIAKGMFLIPYAFPTLNERSLQRLTRL